MRQLYPTPEPNGFRYGGWLEDPRAAADDLAGTVRVPAKSSGTLTCRLHVPRPPDDAAD
jgi:hypothetical protein